MKRIIFLLWGLLRRHAFFCFCQPHSDEFLLIRALRPLFVKVVAEENPSPKRHTVACGKPTLFSVRFPQILKFSQFELPFYGSAVRAPPQNA